MIRTLFFMLLAGCQTEALDCSALQPCNAGAYKFCKQGGGGCFYSLSDGSVINCTACDNCQSAVQSVQNWCDPVGQVPDMAGALSMSGGVVIPKTGPAYTGMKNDPGLNSLADCPDAILEPNDAAGTSLGFTPTPDQPTSKIIKLAICPKGPNPGTGQHDEDWFKVDNSLGASSLTLMAEAFYDISLGDVDIAIVDSTGHLLASDGTAVANGCTTATIGSDVYYVVVTGAGNLDVNRYELLIRSFAASRSCP
jgi:hypothetical protein